ncbi:MAG: hypothetical protein GY953_48755, partial [bacterium]|nr:hypothetical protein [bacterium]
MTDWNRVLCVRKPDAPRYRRSLRFEGRRTLVWHERRILRFDFHWLYEGAGGVLDGDFGVPIHTSTAVNIRHRLEGNLKTTVTAEEEEWLRLRIWRVGSGGVVADCQADLAELPEPLDPLLRALIRLPGLDHILSAGLNSLESFHQLPQPTRSAIRSLGGRILTDGHARLLRKRLEEVRTLRDDIYHTATKALERKRTLELARTEEPLADCSFALTPEGVTLCQRALAGDLSSIAAGGPHVRRSGGVPGSAAAIEIHLPLLERKWWNKRLELLTGMRAEAGDDGRLLVHRTDTTAPAVESDNCYQGALLLAGALPRREPSSPARFTLSYTHRHRAPASRAATAMAPLLSLYGFDDAPAELFAQLPGDAKVETRLSLRIPGRWAACWLRLKGERSLDHYYRYIEVASAVQQAMRTWLPFVYFRDINRYDDFDTAYPLVVYQASKPFRRKARAEFTYDPMNLQNVDLALRQSTRVLPAVLRSIHRDLDAAGKHQTAGLYLPSRARKIVAAVRRAPKRFRGLLASDAMFLRELVKLGNRGRQLREDLESSPETAARKLSWFFDSFAHAFHTRLRRLYRGQECLGFASL